MLSAYYGYRKALSRATGPVAVLVACLLVALLIGIVTAAQEQSRSADDAKRILAADSVTAKGIALAQNAVDYANWDELGTRMLTEPNPAWADSHVGRSVVQNFGVDLVFLVQSDGRTLYAYRKGQRGSLPVEGALTDGWLPLFNAARQSSVGNARWAVVLAEGQPALAAASPVLVPGQGRGDPPPILVFVHRLDGSLLRDMSHTYSLSDLRLAAAQPEGASSLALKALDDKVLGYLDWGASESGDVLLRVTLPIWGVLAMACAATAVLVRRQLNHAARLLSIGEWRAKHDALTELPNRVLMTERLEELCRSLVETGRGFALLYLDLDGFKAVNDTEGHEAGDQVLRAIARRIGGLIGPEDLAVRLGGDEFCVLLGSHDRRGRVLPLAETLSAAIGEPIRLRNDHEVRVGTTIGVTIAPEDGTSPRQLLHRADDALYHGKRIGKGRICFHHDLPMESPRMGADAEAFSAMRRRLQRIAL